MKQQSKYIIGKTILCRHCDTNQKIVSVVQKDQNNKLVTLSCGFELPIFSKRFDTAGTLFIKSIPLNSELILRNSENEQVLKIKSFEQPSHDFPSGVINTRIANTRTNKWKHKVIEKSTGKTIHSEDEPLTEHRPHKH